ncbi:MAG TPA: hypothetical protein VEK73_02870 [Xanthobacteraceae bacterium]|nr:hypothetical protein [Xanthobacteraceae bacterium]
MIAETIAEDRCNNAVTSGRASKMLAWTRLLLAVLSIAGGVPTAVSSEPAGRFPQSHITVAEWQTFLAEVKAKPGARDVSRPERPDILAIAVEPELTFYHFTKSGPAHPAVVVEQVIQRDGAIYIQQFGYYAGAEDAFAQWFGKFQERADAIREGLKARTQSPSP